MYTDASALGFNYQGHMHEFQCPGHVNGNNQPHHRHRCAGFAHASSMEPPGFHEQKMATERNVFFGRAVSFHVDH